MLSTFPYYDMAFWVAFWFALGSAIYTVSRHVSRMSRVSTLWKTDC